MENNCYNLAPQRLYTIKETSRLLDLSKRMLYRAIKLKQLKARKIKNQWFMTLIEMECYVQYLHENGKIELLLHNLHSLYSIQQTAKLLHLPYHKVYYAIKTSKMEVVKKGAYHLIPLQSIREYQKQYTSGKIISIQLL